MSEEYKKNLINSMQNLEDRTFSNIIDAFIKTVEETHGETPVVFSILFKIGDETHKVTEMKIGDGETDIVITGYKNHECFYQLGIPLEKRKSFKPKETKVVDGKTYDRLVDIDSD